jgi:ParB family chromosome partitioning protein
MSKPKGGLGKGLSALIRPPAQNATAVVQPSEPVQATRQHDDQSIAHIEISRIRPNPFQPRADFDQQALDELKDSIKQKGVLQAITVRRANDGMFELISGERRIRASMELGLKTIPAYVIEVKNNQEMLELALIENLQREHLNAIEIAISYQRLINDVGLSPEQIAEKVSKDRTTVVNFLRLLKLPQEIQQSLRKGIITAGHARALVSLPDEQTQLRLFDQVVKKDLNVRQVEKLVKDVSKKSEKKVFHLPKSTEHAISTIEDRLRQVLGTKVKVNIREDGMGDIMIEFYSNDDLNRIYEILTTMQVK